jgi:hypothetical protein
MTSPNLRKLNEHCPKCGAVGGEYCKHSSGSKREVDPEELMFIKMVDFLKEDRDE